MKKILATLVLALVATVASAEITGFTTFDYNHANANAAGARVEREALVGLAMSTKYGTVDAGVLGRQLESKTIDNNLGFEVGYSNGIKLGAVAVDGRVAFGHINQVSTGNSEYYSLAAEAKLPVTADVTAFGGYRFTAGLNAATPKVENRFMAGVDLALTKRVSARVGYAFTKQAGLNFNGITTGLSYKF